MDVPYFSLYEKPHITLYEEYTSKETLKLLKHIDTKRLYTYHKIKVQEQKKPINMSNIKIDYANSN